MNDDTPDKRPRTRHSHIKAGNWEFIDIVPRPDDVPEGLEMFVIQSNPKDHPGKFVVRRWIISATDRWVDETPMAICDTLEAARLVIQPRPRLNLGICKDTTDPSVIEMWM